MDEMVYIKKAKVTKAGNSLNVVVPAQLVRKFGLKSGDEVDVEYDVVNGKVTYIFTNMRQLNLV